MHRRVLLAALVVFVTVGLGAQSPRTSTGSATPAQFSIVEATVSEMQQAMAEGRVTSRELVALSLQRIAVRPLR